jgi:hypothetical protein
VPFSVQCGGATATAQAARAERVIELWTAVGRGASTTEATLLPGQEGVSCRLIDHQYLDAYRRVGRRVEGMLALETRASSAVGVAILVATIPVSACLVSPTASEMNRGRSAWPPSSP